MALNYDYTQLMTGFSQRLGSFWVSMKIDWDEIRRGAFMNDLLGIPSSTDFKVGKLKGGTVIRDSYYRITRAAKGNTDYNIGITEAGTQISGGLVAADTTSDWTQGSIDPNDSIASLAKATENHYIWVMIDSEALFTGNLEIMLECVAGADDNY
jgi:hypothetical protein